MGGMGQMQQAITEPDEITVVLDAALAHARAAGALATLGRRPKARLT